MNLSKPAANFVCINDDYLVPISFHAWHTGGGASQQACMASDGALAPPLGDE